MVCLCLSKYSTGVSFACVLVRSFPAPVGFQCSVKRHDPFSRLVVVLSPGWRGVKVDGGMAANIKDECLYLAPRTISWEARLKIQSTAEYLQYILLRHTDHRVVDSERRNRVQANSSYGMRIASQNGEAATQSSLLCVAAWLL